MILFALFSTTRSLQCFVVHYPDFMSRLSSPFFCNIIVVEASIFGAFFVGIDFRIIYRFCQHYCFLNVYEGPTALMYLLAFCSFSLFLVVPTHNSPLVFSFIWSFVWELKFVGRIKLIIAQSSCSFFMYRAASASTLSSVDSSCWFSDFKCQICLFWRAVYWLRWVNCCLRGALRTCIFAVHNDAWCPIFVQILRYVFLAGHIWRCAILAHISSYSTWGWILRVVRKKYWSVVFVVAPMILCSSWSELLDFLAGPLVLSFG